MLHSSYQIGGILFAIFLAAVWVATVFALGQIVSRSRAEHRSLMTQINRKMDTVLLALSTLQDANRQKPDGSVENLPDALTEEKTSIHPSVEGADSDADSEKIPASDAGDIDPSHLSAESETASSAPQAAAVNPYYQIMPLARKGMDVAAISHQLQLSEDEVAMVIRMNESA